LRVPTSRELEIPSQSPPNKELSCATNPISVRYSSLHGRSISSPKASSPSDSSNDMLGRALFDVRFPDRAMDGEVVTAVDCSLPLLFTLQTSFPAFLVALQRSVETALQCCSCVGSFPSATVPYADRPSILLPLP